MARRLNALLATLAQMPDAKTTTKEKLAALCQAERDRMAEHLDDLAMINRRSGRARENEDIAHDLIAGWSCRLMEHFGFRRDVTFDANCPARGYLKAEGITDAVAVQEIKANFDRDRLGYQSPVFDREMAGALAEHAIDDTLANRERAKIAYFQGRADALMDFASRHGLPHESASDLLERAMSTLREPVDPRADNELADVDQTPAPDLTLTADDAVVPAGSPRHEGVDVEPSPALFGFVPYDASITIQASYGTGSASAGDGSTAPTSAGRALWQDPSFSPKQTFDRADEDWDPSFFDDATNDLRLDGANHARNVLPVSEFPEMVAKIIKNKREHWTTATATDFRAAVDLLISILKEHGVAHSGEMRQQHLGAYRDHLNEIPTHWGKSSRLRPLSAPELREAAQRMKREAEEKTAAGKAPKPAQIGLHANTIRKHFGNIRHLLEGVHGYGYRLNKMTFRGLRPPKPKRGAIRFQTTKVGAADLLPIFQSPLYTGCDAYLADGRVTPGRHVFHDSLYWLPMLYIYLGARRSELAYLMIEDIERDPIDGWVVHIRENKFRRLKNPQSHRTMPLPDEVIRLGFLDYRQAIIDRGSELLFPDLCNGDISNNLGDAFYKDFQAFLVATLDESRWDRAIHALRHGFANLLKQAGVSTEQIDELSGRMGETETSIRYTAPQEVKLQRKLLANLPNLTEHLEPHAIRLAPWVEEGGERPRRGRMPKRVEAAVEDDISDSDADGNDSESNAVL